MVGAEFERFLVIADSGFVHLLVLTLLAQQGVFHGQSFQQGFAAADLVLQFADACLLLGDDAQLSADIALYHGLFDVVAGMDGQEEIVQKGVEVLTVEGFYGIVVLLVGLALEECLSHHFPIVVATGKGKDLGTDKDVGGTDGLLQRNALQRGAAA